MNTKRRLNRALGIAIVASFLVGSTSLASGTDQSGSKPVRTGEEAKRLPVGSQVTLACAKCKTAWTTQVGQNRSFLAWFEPKTKHECPGCGGHMTVYTIGNPGHGLYAKSYTHTCSICGANSAACSSNAPGHKPN